MKGFTPLGYHLWTYSFSEGGRGGASHSAENNEWATPHLQFIQTALLCCMEQFVCVQVNWGSQEAGVRKKKI